MSRLRQLCAVFVLTCALAGSAFAGDIHCGVTDPPPPTAGTNGDIHCGVTDAVLTLLEGVLAAF